jgi:cation transport regulator ChaC
VFGYASLVSAASAGRTVGREVRPLGPVRLHGWRRRWSQYRDNERCEKTFALADGTIPGHVLGLNLEPSDDDGLAPNGVLIELTDEELARLDVREMRYDRVDVSANVELPEGIERVVTYTARAEHFAPSPPHGAVVLASYAGTVDSAFASLGEEQRRLYRATTGGPPVDVVDAELVRDRIPPGNPREW